MTYRCRHWPLLLLFITGRAWKPDRQPTSDACASWCVYDQGQKGHVDACLDAFKRHQCGGCERCKSMRVAEEQASAAAKCEACHKDCGGEQPLALMSEVAALRSERDALNSRLAELNHQRDHDTKEIASLRAQLQHSKSGPAAAEAPGASSSPEPEQGRQRVVSCRRILEALRAQQPGAYATLMLNTAANSSLKTAAGSFVSQLLVRRPWPSVESIKGVSGGVHGIGTDRVKLVSDWASQYVPPC